MQLWKELVRCRNISDHAQYEPECIMNYPLFSSQHEAFSLMLHEYLGKMMSIKAELME